MIFQIPEDATIEIKTIVLDLNGTLSVNGKISKKTKEKIKILRKLNYRIVLLSGDMRGTAQKFAKDLDIELIKAKNAQEKGEAIKKLNPKTCASIGNARIDIETFKIAKIAIATMQAEGIHAAIIKHVDIITPTIEDALNLFIDSNSFCATMRK